MKDYYQLKKDDDKTFEIYDTRDKSSFIISKKDLHPARQVQVMKLKKYAEGGEVEQSKNFGEFFQNVKAKKAEEDSKGPFFFEAQLPKRYERPMGIPYMPQPVAAMPEPQMNIPTTPGPMVASNEIGPNAYGMYNVEQAPTTQQQMMPQVPQGPSFGSGYGQQIAGLKGMAQAESAEAKAQAKALEDQQLLLQDVENQRQMLRQKFQERDDRLGQALEKEGNLSSYWGNLSTGGKVSTAIGMLLGGLGAGITGKENLAMQIINDNINKSVEMNKELYKRNREEYKDDEMALLQTKSDMLTLAGMEAKRIANQFGGQKAMANYQMLSGQLAQQQAQVQGQMERKGLENRLTQMTSQQGAGSPEAIVAAMEGVNPERAKELRGRMVPGLGFATTPEAQKAISETRRARQTVKEGVEELRKMTDSFGKSLSPDAIAKAQILRNKMIGALRVEFTGPGSMSEGDRALLEQSIPDPTAFFSRDDSTRTKLDTLDSLLDSSYKAALESGGIKVSNKSQNQEAEDWLRNNPNHPKAKEVRRILGR